MERHILTGHLATVEVGDDLLQDDPREGHLDSVGFPLNKVAAVGEHIFEILRPHSKDDFVGSNLFTITGFNGDITKLRIFEIFEEIPSNVIIDQHGFKLLFS